jgi:hypothetical protein
MTGKILAEAGRFISFFFHSCIDPNNPKKALYPRVPSSSSALHPIIHNGIPFQ